MITQGEFDGCVFKNCLFKSCVFEVSDIKNCTVEESDIRDTNVSGSTLTDTTWKQPEQVGGKERDMWIKTEKATVQEKLINMAKVKSVGVRFVSHACYWVEAVYENDSVDALAIRTTAKEAYAALDVMLKELGT